MAIGVEALKVAARWWDRQAMEFPSEEARKKYFKDHPDADRSKHTVKEKASKADTSSVASKAKSRGKETSQHFDTMKSLLKKVEDADSSSEKKFNSAYKKLLTNGEDAAKAAKKVISQFDDSDLDEDSQAFAALEMLNNTVRDWEHNKLDHLQAEGSLSHKKIRQAENTAGYAMKIDEWLGKVHEELK